MNLLVLKKKYVHDLLKETKMVSAKSFDTSIILNVKLESKDRELLEDSQVYRHLVGKLNYLNITRLGIASPLSVVS